MVKITTQTKTIHTVEFKIGRKTFIHHPEDYITEDGDHDIDYVYLTKKPTTQNPVVGYIEAHNGYEYGFLPALFTLNSDGWCKVVEGSIKGWLKRGYKMLRDDYNSGVKFERVQGVELFN